MEPESRHGELADIPHEGTTPLIDESQNLRQEKGLGTGHDERAATVAPGQREGQRGR
jgi:hypothetical protein